MGAVQLTDLGAVQFRRSLQNWTMWFQLWNFQAWWFQNFNPFRARNKAIILPDREQPYFETIEESMMEPKLTSLKRKHHFWWKWRKRAIHGKNPSEWMMQNITLWSPVTVCQEWQNSRCVLRICSQKGWAFFRLQFYSVYFERSTGQLTKKQNLTESIYPARRNWLKDFLPGPVSNKSPFFSASNWPCAANCGKVIVVFIP